MGIKLYPNDDCEWEELPNQTGNKAKGWRLVVECEPHRILREQNAADNAAKKEAEKQAKLKKKNDKKSAEDKLVALGLTKDEIEAISYKKHETE